LALGILIEDFNLADPALTLRVVNLAQLQHRVLDDPTPAQRRFSTILQYANRVFTNWIH